MNEDLFSAEWLLAKYNRGYGTLPIPQPRDHRVAGLLKIWMKCDQTKKKQIAPGLSRDQTGILLAFSERMASLAVRQKDEDLLVLGLLALRIEGGRQDWRENILILSLHFDAAQRIGSDPRRIFEAAANLLCEEPASELRSFLNRAQRDKSIEVMGYVVAQDGDGFRYKRTW